MSERLFGIRGATGAQNTKESIQKNVGQLCREIFAKNSIEAQNIVSLQFTITEDLTAMNPAAALRREDTGIDTSKIPLFCSQEPRIDGSPKEMIRLLLTVYMPSERVPAYVYINGAEKLRPDFAGKQKKL